MRWNIYTAIFVFLLSPRFVLAQTEFINILETIKSILDEVIPLLITLALVYFFWGMAKFILHAGDPEGRRAGVSIMIWGIIALFVMVSVWGLVAVMQETFGIDQGARTMGVEAFPNFPF